jgi:putative flippase GtrA
MVSRWPSAGNIALLRPISSLVAKNGWLTSQLFRFAAVGIVSTAVHAVIYLIVREWLTPTVANLIALSMATVLNTEANLRLTFRGTRGSVRRVHCQAFVLFGVYYTITSGAVLILHTIVTRPPRPLELAVLLTAAGVGTILRYIALRMWVFKDAA